MTQLDFLRSLRAVPDQVRVTREGLISAESQLAQTQAAVAELHADAAGLRETLHATAAEVRDTINAASTAQLEALRFLTRTVNELSTRLANLERITSSTTA